MQNIASGIPDGEKKSVYSEWGKKKSSQGSEEILRDLGPRIDHRSG